MTNLADPVSWSTTFDGLLFDLDGTLVDSMAAVERQWWTFFDWYRLPADRFPDPLHGRRAEDHIRALLPAHLVAEAADRLAELEATDMSGVKAVPGAAELLESLGSIPWGVVTSGRLAVATARLAAVGLPIPRILVTAENVRAGKPDPEPFALGRSLLAAPGTVVAFEDAPAGVTSAKAAGCHVVGLATSHPATDLGHADAVVTDLTAVRVTAPKGDDAAVLTATLQRP